MLLFLLKGRAVSAGTAGALVNEPWVDWQSR